MSLNNQFKAALTRGEKLLGGWHMSGSAVVAEAMGHVGYDFVVLDMEHGPQPIQGVADNLRALDAARCPGVVRMADHDPTAIKFALDLGARSLYFPMVQNAIEAQAILRSCYYPPVGDRGFARMLRASGYTQQSDYFERINDDLFLVAQLETLEAIGNLDSIATLVGKPGGLHGLFVGPGDLSVTMGFGGNVLAPEVTEQLAKVGLYCKERGIPLGIVLPNPERVRWAFDHGYTFVSMASDMGLMLNAMRAGISAVKSPQ